MTEIEGLIAELEDGGPEEFEIFRNVCLRIFAGQNEVGVVETRKGKRYSRTMIMEPGTLVIGDYHKQPFTWIMMNGEMVTRQTGDDHATTLVGFCMGTGEMNKSRIGITRSRTLWTTVHVIPEWVDKGREMDYITGKLCLQPS